MLEDVSLASTNPILEVKIRVGIIPQVTQIKYIGFIIQNDGEIERDVTIGFKLDEMVKCFGVICDKKEPLNLKGKFYRTTIRSMMLY